MKCSVEVCNKPIRANKLCKGHYSQLSKHGKIVKEMLRYRTPIAKKYKALCTELFCVEEQKAKGLCNAHYRQLWVKLTGYKRR